MDLNIPPGSYAIIITEITSFYQGWSNYFIIIGPSTIETDSSLSSITRSTINTDTRLMLTTVSEASLSSTIHRTVGSTGSTAIPSLTATIVVNQSSATSIRGGLVGEAIGLAVIIGFLVYA